MPNELYEYRIFTKFRTKKQSVRFHIFLDNVANIPPFQSAQEITYNLNVATLFLTLYAQMVSQESGITDTICRRVLPVAGPSSRVHIPGGGLQGLWLGPIAENFVAANIKWQGVSGNVNKCTSRIGPIGDGAITNTGYYSVFEVAAQTFCTDACTPRVGTSGNTFHLTLLRPTGITEQLTSGELTWPPARQINRRWEP